MGCRRKTSTEPRSDPLDCIWPSLVGSHGSAAHSKSHAEKSSRQISVEAVAVTVVQINSLLSEKFVTGRNSGEMSGCADSPACSSDIFSVRRVFPISAAHARSQTTCRLIEADRHAP